MIENLNQCLSEIELLMISALAANVYCAKCKKHLGKLGANISKLSKDALITVVCKKCHGEIFASPLAFIPRGEEAAV
jgi:hypothetical protein